MAMALASGSNFNHPCKRTYIIGATRANGGEHPERASQSVCQVVPLNVMIAFSLGFGVHLK